MEFVTYALLGIAIVIQGLLFVFRSRLLTYMSQSYGDLYELIGKPSFYGQYFFFLSKLSPHISEGKWKDDQKLLNPFLWTKRFVTMRWIVSALVIAALAYGLSETDPSP